jgi:hypothetical protein
VAGEDPIGRPEAAGEAFNTEYRAMLTAGTADCNRQVASVVQNVVWQPVFEEARDVVDHPSGGGYRLEKRGNRLIESGEGSEGRFVVGIGQAAHIEDEVGIERNARLVGEGFEQQGQRGSVRSDEFADPFSEDVGMEVAGVDRDSQPIQCRQQLAFALDRLEQGSDRLASNGLSR